MLLNNHILKLVVAFVFGILFAHYSDLHWVIYFTIWSTFLISLLVTIHFGRKVIQFRKLIGLQIMIVFLLSGAFSYQYSLPSSQRKHFSKYYLHNDVLLAKISEIDRDSVGYRKMIIEIKGVGNALRNRSCIGKMLVYENSSLALSKGDIISFKPRVQKIENSGNPGGFDAKKYWHSKGIYQMSFVENDRIKRLEKGKISDRFWIRIRDKLRAVIYDHLTPQNRTVANALVLGDKSDLSDVQKQNFSEAGAMHVLAVSGMHVGILLGFLQWIFYRISFLRKRGLFVISALLIVWCFAFVTGLSSSVLRATIMFSVLAVGQLRGYSFFSMNALLVSALIILFIDPLSLFDVGFQLSFLAMLGISFFFNPIRNLITSRYKLINFFWDGTALGIAAQIGTIPISLYYFNQFPNYFILTNLGLLILAAVALISVLFLFSTFWIPWVSSVVGDLVDFIFSLLNMFIEWVNGLPGTISRGFDPSQWWVMLIYISIVSALIFYRKRKLFAFYAALSSIFVLGVFLVINRERNYASNKLVFLNQNVPCVMVKLKGAAIVVYQAEKMKGEELNYLVNGVQKKLGVQVARFPLSKNKQITWGEDLKVRSLDCKLIIRYYGQDIVFTNSRNTTYKRGSIVIGNQLNKHDDLDFTTKHGAITLLPNGKQF